MSKTFINACLTGMVPQKKDTPHVPVTPKEIIEDALFCGKNGASIVHIHPRDKNGIPTWRKEVFAEIIAGIREKNKELIISVTTSGRYWSEIEKRSEVLDLQGDLKPDLASLTVGSLNFISATSMNTPDTIETLAHKMMERGIKPELEVFEPGMVHKANYLLGKGIIKDECPYFNIFLGSLGTAPLEPSTFAAFYSLLPKNSIWAVGGIGRFQLDANLLALSMGGGIRTGIEDNIYFDREKKELASNVTLIKRIKDLATLTKIEVSTALEMREELGLWQKKELKK